MDGNGLDFSKILKMVTENPAMLQTAMSFAGKLKDNIGPSPAQNVPEPETVQSSVSNLPVKTESSAREDERRLLLALRPYLGKTRQDKIDFILKILQLLELAGSLGLTTDQKTKGAPPNDV